MKTILSWAHRAAYTTAAWACWALGGWDAALMMLFLMMGLDLFSGLLVALAGRSDKTAGGGFLSRAFTKGLSRKLMMLSLVMLATALDAAMHTTGVCRLAVIGFYSANEGLSVVENAALLGLPFPRSVLAVMERMRDKETEEGDGGK